MDGDIERQEEFPMGKKESREKEPKQTNVVVLVGPPSSGKSTQFEDLHQRLDGFTPIPEVERAIIEKDMKEGIKRDSTPRGHLELEARFLEARKVSEEGLDPNTYYLMDRGLADIVAYARYYKGSDDSAVAATAEKIEKEALEAAQKTRYKTVLYLEPLESYEQDSTRVEDPEFAQWMHENLPKVYEELGYDVIRVPAFAPRLGVERSEEERIADSVRQRTEFIIEKMKEEGMLV